VLGFFDSNVRPIKSGNESLLQRQKTDAQLDLSEVMVALNRLGPWARRDHAKAEPALFGHGKEFAELGERTGGCRVRTNGSVGDVGYGCGPRLGSLTEMESVAAAERALRAHKGYRYFAWTHREGVFEFFEEPVHFGREKRLEDRYVISMTETALSALDAVALYKQLTEVERGFRRMKDVLSMRPVYHQVEPRVLAHIFVAALGLLLQTLLQHRLDEAAVELSAEQALQALETVRHVRFEIGGESRTGVSVSNPRARQVLNALAITNVRPPNPPVGDLTVIYRLPNNQCKQ
jgi:hypothetical protein